MIPSSRFSSVLLVLFAAIFVTLALSAVEVKGQWGLIGTFDPARGSDLDRTAAIGAWTGKNQAVQLVFTTFDWQENNWLWNALVAIWNQGAVPIISWEPWFQQANGTPENIEVLIANGQYDTYISGWANSLKTFLAGPDGKMNTADDRRAYMRFAHEMNGNWYPWSARTGESSPNDYVRMWRKVQSIVTNAGCSRSQHVQWIFSGICIDVGDFKIEQYYPGNDYVDWVGLGGMNWGTSESWAKWNMPVDLFAQMVPRVRALSGNTKPFGITEYCVVTNGGGIGGKNTWITTMFDFAKQNQIKMMSYFNMDKNEGDNGGLKDWAIFGGVNGDETYWQNGRSFKGYSAYRTAVGSNYWIAGNTNLAKRIDDKYFFGTGTCNTNNDCLSGYSCSGGNCVEGSSTNDQASSGGNSAPAPAISSSSAPSSKTKTVFSDSVAPPAYSWGSGGLSFKYNAGDSSAPEGKNSAQVTSTGWGGFGLFYDPNWQSFSGYSKIRFSMKSNNAVKLELQDSNGAKAPSYVPSTNGAWKVIEIPLSTFSNAGVNLGSINGAFVTTMEAAGQYSVDDIQFV